MRFHSISFSSEWRLDSQGFIVGYGSVSIQLVSPASGDLEKIVEEVKSEFRFHSISFPSEWERCDRAT